MPDLLAPANRAVQIANTDGSVVFDLTTGRSLNGKDLWAVGLFNERQQQVTGALDVQTVRAFMNSNADVLLDDLNRAIAVWPAHGHTCLDVVRPITDQSMAIQIGVRHSQRNIVNLQSLECLSLGKFGGPDSPESLEALKPMGAAEQFQMLYWINDDLGYENCLRDVIWEQFWTTLERACRPAVRRVIWNPTDQADVMNEIGIRLAQHIKTASPPHRYNPAEPFLPWIATVVWHEAIHYIRPRRANGFNLEDAVGLMREEDDDASTRRSSRVIPSYRSELSAEDRVISTDLTSRLSPQQSEYVSLRLDYPGAFDKEIAGVMGVTQSRLVEIKHALVNDSVFAEWKSLIDRAVRRH